MSQAFAYQIFSIFWETDTALGTCSTGNVGHKIETSTHVRKLNMHQGVCHMHEEVVDHVSNMLSIEPSHSQWSSTFVLVTKRTGRQDFCVDYRRHNTITTIDTHYLVLTSFLISYEDPNGSVHYISGYR